jgi:hypothetical protein
MLNDPVGYVALLATVAPPELSTSYTMASPRNATIPAHLARAEAERSEGPGFGDSKEAERLRRYQLTYNRLLLRILEALRKRRRDAARKGAAGSSRPRAAAIRGVTNEATDPASSEVGSESVAYTDRCPAPADPPPNRSSQTDPIRTEDYPVPAVVTNEATSAAASDVGRKSEVVTDRCLPATDDLPDRSPEPAPEPTDLPPPSSLIPHPFKERPDPRRTKPRVRSRPSPDRGRWSRPWPSSR